MTLPDRARYGGRSLGLFLGLMCVNPWTLIEALGVFEGEGPYRDTVYLSKFVCSSFTVVEAIVGKPAVLPCAIVCHGDNNWTRFIPDTTTVARCVSGTCRIGADFKERFTFTGNATRGNISLLINPAVYNDIGSYTCSCGGKTADVKLQVFVPTVVVARELETITLPCYGDTRRNARDAQWQKDGQRVLHYDSKTGTVTHGRGYEERCMLSKGFADGDLSLHIGSVSESDEGIYRCTIHDESWEGEPRAVLLKVENNKTDGSLGFGTGVSIGVAITAFTAASMVLAVYLWRRYKRCQPFQHPIAFLFRS
ncbi:uncharacterized protein LOC118240385 [Electrophorus electricus]|uniref:uncharacterized protein LOC118240385 n=1 Tax=Electrophorus electricus TaxID=8005 RepID=UPI0015D05223|nr:uncharacterized protein LOC118240385 [Electrophorus electricus]